MPFFFSSRRRHTRCLSDWSSDVCSSDLWRIRRVESARGRLLVEDAHGAPPNVPFWRGEAPARTDELSLQVSDLREKRSEERRVGKECRDGGERRRVSNKDEVSGTLKRDS